MPRKPAHQRGSYQRLAAAIVARARANPDTRCWRCGHTLHQHPNHRTGRPPEWNAGHINPGEVGGLMLAEVSTCNLNASNKTVEPHSRRW